MIALLDNPPIGYEGTTVQHARWWIAHTKSRSEKAFAWDLMDREIGYFLPLVQSVSISGGRRRRVLKPLFPSYVFFRGDDDARHRAIETGRLCQVLAVPDQAQIERELSTLQTALDRGQPVDAYPFAAVGKRCRIASGRLQGIEGIVVERSKTTKIVLQVTMLGRGALLEMDPGLLEGID